MRAHDDEAKARFLRALGVDREYLARLPLPNQRPVEAKTFWHWQSIWGTSWRATQTQSSVPYIITSEDIGDVAHQRPLPILSNSSGARKASGWATPLIFFADHSQRTMGGFMALYCYSGPFEGQTFYYEWVACDHDWKSSTIGNCLTQYTCRKCTASYQVDSSD